MAVVGVGGRGAMASGGLLAPWSSELLLVPTYLDRLLIKANDYGVESFFHFCVTAVGHSHLVVGPRFGRPYQFGCSRAALIVALVSLFRVEYAKIVFLLAMLTCLTIQARHMI